MLVTGAAGDLELDPATWEDTVADPLRRVFERLVEYLPNLLGAITLLVVGCLLALVLRAIARRLTPTTRRASSSASRPPPRLRYSPVFHLMLRPRFCGTWRRRALRNA